LRVATAVASAHGASVGQVEFLWDGRVVAIRTLRNGHAHARVPAHWLTRGTHRVQVVYLGSYPDASSRVSRRAFVR
jgi:hypothetical protein